LALLEDSVGKAIKKRTSQEIETSINKVKTKNQEELALISLKES